MKPWISDFRLVDNAGSLKAFADLTCDDITIKGFRVVQKTLETRPWVGFPQIHYAKDGKTKYRDVIELPQSLRKEITDLILAEYQKHLTEIPF